jgi:hypothetical protein
MALLASLATATASHADSMPGSTESLSVSAPPGELGKPVTVTVSGTADGAHYLVVDGAYLEAGQGHSPACTPAQAEGTRTLTPSGGQALPPGPFETHFIVAPQPECDYFVSAYLEVAGNKYPDAWGSYCAAWWEEDSPGVWGYVSCVHPTLSFGGLLAAEELGQRVLKEEEQQAHEQRVREEAQREAIEEAAAHQAKEEAERKAREAAARCHVPNLHDHTLAGSRRLLKASHCRIGKVTVKRHGRGTLRVAAQAPRHGLVRSAGTRVSVTLD